MSLSSEKHKKKKYIVIWIILFIVLLCLSIFGVISWKNYQYKQYELKEKYRKAHRDSVARLNKEKEYERFRSEQEEKHVKSVCKFIESFYKKIVLNDYVDCELYEHYLTPKLQKNFFGEQGEYYDIDKRAVWIGAFGSQAGVNDNEQLIRNLKVVHEEGKWYKVRLSQNGLTEYHLVKIALVGNSVLIDDVK